MKPAASSPTELTSRTMHTMIAKFTSIHSSLTPRAPLIAVRMHPPIIRHCAESLLRP